jgi:hypothetical protein
VPNQLELKRKILKETIPLIKIADVQRGITPFQLVQKSSDNSFAVALDGELKRYYHQFSGNYYVKYDETIAEYKPEKYFVGKRLILRELISRQFRLQCVFVEQDYITNKSHQSILKVDPNFDLFYLLSVLNSKLLSYYHVRSSAIALRDDFPKIVLDETRNLPILRIAFTTLAKARARLLAEAQRLYAACLTTSDFAELLAFTAAQLSAQPERSDVIHDLLAFLAERMITMNKEKRQAALQFLTDLKEFHRIDVHLLKPKTLLDDFWKLETPELFTHFKKNKKVLATLQASLTDAVEDRIRTRFEKAKAVILPLEQQIAFTDHLIDQIVYKLYGLTEDEIRLVEGV